MWLAYVIVGAKRVLAGYDRGHHVYSIYEILMMIMHSAGSPTSLCIMSCYALSNLILSVQGHFVPGRSHAL